MDISDVARRARDFSRVLDEKKRKLSPSGFDWYPYGTMYNFATLDRLLQGANRRALPQPDDGPVADIGAADGDSAFFLESLGYRVHAIDYAPTNYNSCRAIRLLKQSLDSKVEILEVDLDSQFVLPAQEYALVFFLGILYHLKNPYFALEALARRARCAFISTRITRYNVARSGVDRSARVNRERVELADVPVAYLVAPDETNNDATNFWMFTDAGLRRILDRTGWDVLDYMTVGNTRDSDPATQAGDERAFCYVRSRHFGAPAA